MKILSGKFVAASIEAELKKHIEQLSSPPTLAVILVGDHPPSVTYVARKQEACHRCHIRSLLFKLSSDCTLLQLKETIQQCNEDPSIHGILLQLPLPSHLNQETVIALIDPKKDVDGLHPFNMGYLMAGSQKGFVPCTPLGIQQLLIRSQIVIEGKEVVIVGRSQLVGRPLANLLSQKAEHANATVTLAHSQSPHLDKICQRADILIVAIGKAHFITQEMVKEGAVVIDVGIHRTAEGTITGDVDFEAVAPKCSAISPVPGGVGPMTIAMLLSNTLKAKEMSST